MYCLDNLLGEIFGQAQSGTFGNTGFHNVLIASRLHHTQVMRFLEQSDFARNAHASCQYSEQLVVTVVNLLAQQAQLVINRGARAHDEPFKNVFERCWRNLLGAIAQSAIWFTMTFYHQAVKACIERQLGQGLDKFPLSADMGGITQNGHVWRTAPQLKGDMPLRVVTIDVGTC